MTLNDVTGGILRYFTVFDGFWGHTSKSLKIDLYCLEQKWRPKNLSQYKLIICGDVRRAYRERVHYREAHAPYTL